MTVNKEGGVRVCGIAVLAMFWCGVAVIFISKYGIAVFRAQAVCGEFKILRRSSRWKNRCVTVICFFFMTRGYKSKKVSLASLRDLCAQSGIVLRKQCRQIVWLLISVNT